MRATFDRAVCVAALALVALGGCGETTLNDTPESHEQAKAAVETWLGACSNQDSEPVVEVLPEAEREIIFKATSVLAGCAEIARLGLPPEAPAAELEKGFEEATVERVEVAGGFGSAVLRGVNGTTSELQLEVDRGRWTLSNPPLVAP